MRRWILPAILVVAAVLASPSASIAADVDSYVAVKAGIYSPQEGTLRDFDDGFNGEVSIGWTFTPRYALELGVGYFETEGRGAIIAPGPAVVPADVKIFVIPATVTMKILYPVSMFEPYAEGGVGVYVAEAELAGGGLEFSDRYTNIGFHLGLGANVNFTEKLFLGVEGRYLWVAEHKFELGQTTQAVELDGYTVTAVLGYRFDTKVD